MPKEKILFLGSSDSPLLMWLLSQGESVFQISDKIAEQFVVSEGFSHLVSYGYKHILKRTILEKFPDRAVNLHISYLPWNRGADPNFWSFVDDTCKGVTIHYLDEGVDTGDIIVQQEIQFSENETLATSYAKLQTAIQELFKQYWNEIKNCSCPREEQVLEGSIHRVKDKEALLYLLKEGWNTPVSELIKFAFQRNQKC